MKRLGNDPQFKDQVFYPYVYGDMVRYEPSKAFLKAVLNAGYRWAEEHYLDEQPTEVEALAHIDGTMKRDHLRYQKVFPQCAGQVTANIGHFSIPQLTLDVNPGVDYKVYLDMQMHLVANDPVFRGLYGVSWYHSAYADEEMMRWSAKLNRHYCIEGRTDRLTSDPYELPHLKNPDFQDRLAGWRLEPAEEGSIVADKFENYGQLQGRTSRDEGNRFLVMRRSAKAPNRVSQAVVGLTPGRLYSLRMYVCDRGDLTAGRSASNTHDVTVTIEGGERLPRGSFREVFFNERPFAGFTSENPLYMTYQRIVFRATGETARLVLSDWDTRPAGPIGQKLAINYIQLQPYLKFDP